MDYKIYLLTLSLLEKNKEIIEDRMVNGAQVWLKNMENLYLSNEKPSTIYLFNGKTYPENIISFWANQKKN